MAYATDLCGSKLRAKLTSTFNESSSQKISTTSFAAKQMAKMGWTEGTGLGKKRDGIASHIKVRKREENIGLGVEKERTRQMGIEGMWWSSSVSNTLMKLQQKNKNSKDHKKSKKRRKNGKNKKSNGGDGDGDRENDEIKPRIYTDEELFVATGGARFGMRAQRRAEGKWQRTENSTELKNWELKTKNQAEWNGLGKASVFLSDKNLGCGSDRNINMHNSVKKRKRADDEQTKDDNVDESIVETRENIPEAAERDNNSIVSEKRDKKHEKKLKKGKKPKKNKKIKKSKKLKS